MEENMNTHKIQVISFEMMNNVDDTFDDIDLNELFNNFDENKSPILCPASTPYDMKISTKRKSDDLFELNENDCTAPKVNRKRAKPKKKMNGKQTTMYDYASTVSHKHKEFYSSLDNTTTTKTIIKRQKRSLTDCLPASSISKKTKTSEYDNSSSTPPDFIDNLLRYLDERSRLKTGELSEEQEALKTTDIQTEEK
ncbi:unnamed protein product [Rotaria magnacalcarata]